MRVFYSYHLVLIFCVNYCFSSNKYNQTDPVKKYHNYTLFRAIPLEDKHMYFLSNLYAQNDSIFWKPPGAFLKSVEFMVGPEDKSKLMAEAKAIDLILQPLIEDLQKAFDKQTVKNYTRRDMRSFGWEDYYRYEDIYAWLRDLRRIYPDEMELKVIGKSHQERDILAVIITLKDCQNRSVVFVEGGIHAREWISPAVVTYLIKEILRGPVSLDGALRNISKIYQWIFVPLVNPDGYEYTFTSDRMWRKNRHDYFQNVDLNRNFGYAFGTVGVSYDFSKDTYCGPHAFSENESKALAQFIKSISSKLEYYLSFHSYGQQMIIPYSHTKNKVENYNEVKNICKEAEYIFESRHGTRYHSGNAYDLLGYFASGGSSCWVKKQFQVPYVITFELRDDGRDGFALPTDQIMPTCKETLDALIKIITPKTAYFRKLLYSNYDGEVIADVPLSNSPLIINGSRVLIVTVVMFTLLYIK